jgi:glycosyltransferase involved in cell wall biosynthesis
MGGERPRLLVVSTVPVWPVDNGFALRAAGILPDLAREWSVVLAAPMSGELSPPSEWPVAHFEPLPIDARWSYLPFQYDTRGVRATVQRLVADWHPVAALLFGGAEYVASSGGPFPPAVSDHIDCMTLSMLREWPSRRGIRGRLSLLRDLALVAGMERRTVRAMHTTFVVGEQDAKMLRRLGGGERVEVLANGIAACSWAGWEEAAAVPTVVFTGVLDYPPNVDAAIHLARDIWPLVIRSVPDARLRLVGRRPSDEVRSLTVDPSVAVVADVPSVADELRRGWVAAAPMRTGAGVKNKVLEAWAVGRPVVLTPMAANGLEPTALLRTAIALEPPRLAACLVELLRDGARRRALGEASLAHVRERFMWSRVVGRISDRLRAAAGLGGPLVVPDDPGPSHPCGEAAGAEG